MKKHLLTNIAILLVAFCGSLSHGDDLPRGNPKSLGVSPEKLERVTSLIRDAVEKKQISGAVALLAVHGKIVQLSAYGMQDIESKKPMSDSAIFRIASMSKPITSVAIMQLYEDGKIRLTDKLSKYIPEFKEMQVAVPSQDGKSFEVVPAAREITIHDLLTHSSGITYRIMSKPHVSKLYEDAGVIDGLVESPDSLADNVRKIARLPLVCQPGSAWEYGLNTDVLGLVVEIVSNQSLEDFMRKRLFVPLGMSDTYFNLPQDKHPRLATLYTIQEEGKTFRKVGREAVTTGAFVYSGTVPTHPDNKYFSGGAGLVSTVGDYYRFAQMMLNEGEFNGSRVLKPETVALMTSNQLGGIRLAPDHTMMGYGFGIVTEESRKSEGEPANTGAYAWGGAYGTYFWVDPKEQLVAVFMMQCFPPDFSVSQAFKKTVYEALEHSKK